MAEPTINSITLSPDLSTLYLIDNGRAIPFNLKSKKGVLIGMLDGQLAVATGLPTIVPPPLEGNEEGDVDDPDPPVEDPGSGPGDNPIQRLAERPRLFRIATKKKQFTLMFNPGKGVLSIIGASDIDLNIIGASDIDLNIIGASDIDLNLTRSINPEDMTKKRRLLKMMLLPNA